MRNSRIKSGFHKGWRLCSEKRWLAHGRCDNRLPFELIWRPLENCVPFRNEDCRHQGSLTVCDGYHLGRGLASTPYHQQLNKWRYFLRKAVHGKQPFRYSIWRTVQTSSLPRGRALCPEVKWCILFLLSRSLTLRDGIPLLRSPSAKRSRKRIWNYV